MPRKFPEDQEPRDDAVNDEDENAGEDDEEEESDSEGEDQEDEFDEEMAELESLEADAEDQQDQGKPLAGEELNAELFRSAIESLREVVPAWRQQADLLLGHPVEFAPNFDSLEGRYERVQPFVHLAIAGALEALVKVRFDPKFGSALTAIQKIAVVACPLGQTQSVANLSDSALSIFVPLNGERPPTDQIANAMRAAIAALAPPEPGMPSP